MMITMMTILLCVRFSVSIATNVVSLHDHHMQASNELGYDQQAVSHGFSRKLMHQKMVEGSRDEDFVLYNDQKGVVLGETHKRGEEVMVIGHGAKGPDPTYFTTVDYSHVRRRRPIHNNYSPKSTNSP